MGLMIGALVLVILCDAGAPAPPVLTLETAVQTAVENQPLLHQAEANARSAGAVADQARAGLLPQVSANASYTRLTGNSAPRPGLIPGTNGYTPPAPSGKSYDYYQTGIAANQLVWDFNQTLGKWHALTATAEAQHDTEVATRIQVVLNVRTAYFAARANKDLVQVARESLDNLMRHREQIAGFVSVGTRSDIDLVQAKTDEANGRVALIQAQNNFDISKAQLNQAMGVERSTDYDLANDTLPALPNENASIDTLLSDALTQRPDLAAAQEGARSADLTIGSAQGGYLPSLSLAAGASDNGPQVDRLVWNWQAQGVLQWNLFQGGLTKAQVEQARASLALAEAQEAQIRQQIRLDLEQARLALKAAKEAEVATAEALTNARERHRLAEGRYQTGVGTIIELGDAQVALTQAAAQDVSARYQVSVARAQLAKALGAPPL